MYLVFTTDAWHSHESKTLIGLAISKWYANYIIDEYCIKNDELVLTSEDLQQLESISQTQSQEDRSVEFVVEEVEVNTLL